MITFEALGKMGRLGNQMFSILGTISIAIKSGQEFAFPEWKNYDGERFEPGIDINIQDHFANPLPLLPSGLHFQQWPYRWGYQDLHFPHGNWNMTGHFQCPKYMNNCTDLIRYYLRMKGEVEIRENICAVHMRFGDYDDAYHPRPCVGYYNEAMKHVPPGCVFFLFSDDMPAAIELWSKLDAVVFPVPIDKNYIDSFAIMKRCKHFITANSSYSLMAAILAPNPDKVIVCPKKWFGPAWGSGMNEEMTKDIYPVGAVVI